MTKDYSNMKEVHPSVHQYYKKVMWCVMWDSGKIYALFEDKRTAQHFIENGAPVMHKLKPVKFEVLLKRVTYIRDILNSKNDQTKGTFFEKIAKEADVYSAD